MMRASILLISAACLSLSACKKEPGEGGKTEIRGYVYRQEINNNTGQNIGQPYPYPEARVYIVYGDHDFYDDDVRTGPDGLFVFSWMRKGDYKIYTFGECDQDEPSCPSGQVAIYASASATGKDDVVNVGRLTVENGW